jgi:RNA polymerase sigma factor (sigma-70 family)
MSEVTKLDEADITAGKRGFYGRLRRKGFSPQFIERFGEDLFAEAQFEVTRLIASGGVVYFPRGLLIHCAWRRTQNLLDKQRRHPNYVALDVVAEPEDEREAPQEQVMASDLRHRVKKALTTLPRPEQEIIKLIYLDGMSCRAAAEALGWGKSKGQRKKEAALKRLRPFFERGPDQV